MTDFFVNFPQFAHLGLDNKVQGQNGITINGSDATYALKTVTLVAPTGAALFTNSYSLKFPDSAGTIGQVMETDGFGNLTWVNVGNSVLTEDGRGNIFGGVGVLQPVGNQNFVIGDNAGANLTAFTDNANICIGQFSDAKLSDYGVAIGAGPSAGNSAQAGSHSAVAIGGYDVTGVLPGARGLADYSIAIGSGSFVDTINDESIAIGHDSHAAATTAIVIGMQAIAVNNRDVVIGPSAQTTTGPAGTGGVAIGDTAITDKYLGNDYRLAIGGNQTVDIAVPIPDRQLRIKIDNVHYLIPLQIVP